MSGRELAVQSTVIRPNLPVVYMSGYAEGLLDDATSEATTKITVLEKPFSVAALLATLGRALDRARTDS